MGRDPFGLFMDIAVPARRKSRLDVGFRLRWIPPGRFKMGSPASESGRFARETQHLVTLTEGYWMAETPCTQYLWTAVMDDNPSAFKSPDRPVEQVSFKDVQAFLQRLNEQTPSFKLKLPTEAQWEYACRAGTETSTYAGDLVIAGERNAPVLDAIAWYGGNSGVDFDLRAGIGQQRLEGESSTRTPKRVRERVRLKQPNPWGLFDMLGNVWEWCAGPVPSGLPARTTGVNRRPTLSVLLWATDRVVRGRRVELQRAGTAGPRPASRSAPSYRSSTTWVSVLSEVRLLPGGGPKGPRKNRGGAAAGVGPRSGPLVRAMERGVTKTHALTIPDSMSESAAGSPERKTIPK